MHSYDTPVARAATARRWWALGVLCLSLLVIGFDVTILNVALPTMAEDLHASTGQLQWIADAYVVVLAALLMPAGAIGDRYGRKRMLIAGFVLFGVASALCAYASDTAAVIAARAFMGIGAAIIVPLALAMLPVLFTPEERGRALAIWSMGSGVGLPLGPILGGWLLEHYWWGSIFFINVPVLAVVVVAALVLLPESKAAAPRRLDVVGGLLSVAGLFVFVYGVIEGPDKGWTDPVIVGSLVAGVVLIAAFTVWESRAERRPQAPRRRAGHDRLGLLVQAAGLAGFATVDMSDGYGFLAAWLGLYGLGVGLALAPAVDVMMETLPEDGVGVGTALNNAFRQVGGALGIAIIGTALNLVYRDRVGDVAARLPGEAASSVRDSVVGAIAVARTVGGDTGNALVRVAEKAYVDGMAFGILVSGVVVFLAAVLVVALLGPDRSAPGPAAETPDPEVQERA